MRTDTAIRKMRSRRGYSLAELLAVVLIVSLVGTAVVSGVNVCALVYRRVVRQAEAQTVLSTAETLIRNEFCYSEGVGSSEENPVFLSGSSGVCMQFVQSGEGDDGSHTGIRIHYYSSLDKGEFDSASSIEDVWNLQTSGSMGEEYYTDFDSYTFDADTGSFIMKGLCVKSSDGDTLAALEELVIRTVNGQ